MYNMIAILQHLYREWLRFLHILYRDWLRILQITAIFHHLCREWHNILHSRFSSFIPRMNQKYTIFHHFIGQN